MFKVIHNIETDEITQVPLTQDEIDAILIKQAETEKAEAELLVKFENQKLAREAAQEKLAALGLTIDDLKSLGLN